MSASVRATSGESGRGTGTFQAGGTLREGALYVERAADRELPEALLRREFCYVLAPRQIGKSSLRVRTSQLLAREGVRTVTIDLTTIGSRNSTATEWYYGLLDEIAVQLRLPAPGAFWQSNDQLSPVHRFSRYLQRELLPQVSEPVVIFIDEIDTVLALTDVSRDDFFGSVRAVFNQRAQDPNFERLTFCLIGVAMPSDLVEDEARTPFNIGRAIQLSDFTWPEMTPFLPSLAEHLPDPEAVLHEVFDWSDGHPYMAQTICQALCEGNAGAGQDAATRVQAVVQRVFLDKGRVQDPNLAYAEKSFTAEADRDGARLLRMVQREARMDATPAEVGVRSKESGRAAALPQQDSRSSRTDARVLFKDSRTAAMLTLYGRLRTGQRVPADGQDRVQMALRLTGMAKEQREPEGSFLKVRNRIFAEVFNSTWVRDLQAKRMLATPLLQWLESGRRAEFLLRGEELKAAKEWAQETKELTRTESEFLRAAERAEDRARCQALITLFVTSFCKTFATYLLLLVLREWLVRNRGLTDGRAGEIYNWFFSGTYALSIFGGPFSDRVFGHRRAVYLSLGMMALGYFVLTVPRVDGHLVALSLICLGNGLYKPSFYALLGTHYDADDPRQDNVYLANYWCLNLGAMLAPLAVSTIFSSINAAFAVSGVVMMLGLLVFQRYPESEAQGPRVSSSGGRMADGIRAQARHAAWAADRKRLRSLVTVLLVVSLPFWMAFYQSGDSVSRWLTVSNHNLLDWFFDPTSKREVSRAVNPAFVVFMTPLVFGFLEGLRRTGREVKTQDKLAFGMLLTAVSLLLLGSGAAQRSGLFFIVYCVLATAELLLAPISYALVVRLSPPRFLATALGGWFLVMILGSQGTELLRGFWEHRGGRPQTYELALAAASLLSCFAVFGLKLRGTVAARPTR